MLLLPGDGEVRPQLTGPPDTQGHPGGVSRPGLLETAPVCESHSQSETSSVPFLVIWAKSELIGLSATGQPSRRPPASCWVAGGRPLCVQGTAQGPGSRSAWPQLLNHLLQSLHLPSLPEAWSTVAGEPGDGLLRDPRVSCPLSPGMWGQGGGVGGRGGGSPEPL